MSRSEDSPRTARLFAALALPEDIAGGIAAWAAEVLAPVGDLRTTPPENLHLTLAFLGHRPEAEIAVAVGALRGIPLEAPRLRLRGDVAGIPKGRRPRLLAIELEGEGVSELQAEVSARLAGAGLYEPEERPFWPHLTVARIRPERRGSKRPARLGEMPSGLPGELTERPFDGVRLVIYRSFLRSGGSSYEAQAHFDLPPRAAT